MPVAIVATVGSASANSFITLAEADTYAESRLNASLWDAATTDEQNRALCEATRYLSALRWKGERVDSTQALAWPRAWAPNPDSPALAFNYFSQTIIPQRVKDATAELAMQFIKAGTTDVAALDSSAGVIEETVDVITTRWTAGLRPTGLSAYPSVTRLIGPLLEANANATTLVRG